MQLDYFTYNIPFVSPFRTAHKTFSHRGGIFIRLQKDGITALGEAAPLPGFSKENRGDILQQLQQHQQKIARLSESSFSLNSIKKFLRSYPLYPSLQFGLFSLAATYLAQKKEMALQELLFPDPKRQVPVNVVLGTHATNVMERVDKYVTQGITTIKIKIDEEGACKSVIEKIGKRYPDLSLRIDANQSWSITQATYFLKQVSPFNIEYCEEPLAHPDSASITALTDASPVPIALDESIAQTFSLGQALKLGSSLIIKPAVLGLQCMGNDILSSAKHHQTKLIFTTSLESGIGRLMTASLAAGLGAPDAAHGLTTGSMLASDIWQDDPFIANGRFTLPDAAQLSALMSSDFSAIINEKIAL